MYEEINNVKGNIGSLIENKTEQMVVDRQAEFNTTLNDIKLQNNNFYSKMTNEINRLRENLNTNITKINEKIVTISNEAKMQNDNLYTNLTAISDRTTSDLDSVTVETEFYPSEDTETTTASK